LFGVFTKYEVLASILALSTPALLTAAAVLRIDNPGNYISQKIRSALLPGRLPYTIVVSAGLVAVFLAAIAFLRLDDCTLKVRSHVENNNWIEADRELKSLKEQPLEPAILRALELFVESAESAARHHAPSNNELRQKKDSIEQLLSTRPFARDILVEARADNAKSLFFQEDKKDVVSEAIGFLKQEIEREQDALVGAVYQTKLGELLLVTRQYNQAIIVFERAITGLPEGARRSKALSNIGNVLASNGDYSQAIDYYQSAEAHYPEGRRMIFYSNLGYIHILAGNFQSAIDFIERAIKIDQSDWYSYLNLGIARDELRKHADAQVAYRKVIDNQTGNPDAISEAYIFLGRSIELQSGLSEDAVKNYLNALGRDNGQISRGTILANTHKQNEMYDDIIELLLAVNTHGTERYIEWFRARIKN
jgi:tetratricopeptide (TPR) repeat protein